MEVDEKIESLKEEIEELEKKKEDKEKYDELLKKRNELKFTKLYSAGKLLKKMGGGIANWAEKKNEQIEKDKEEVSEDKKEGKATNNGSDDLYEALFGKNDEIDFDSGLEV